MKSAITHQREDTYPDIVIAFRETAGLLEKILEEDGAQIIWISHYTHFTPDRRVDVTIKWETPIENLSDRPVNDEPGVVDP